MLNFTHPRHKTSSCIVKINHELGIQSQNSIRCASVLCDLGCKGLIELTHITVNRDNLCSAKDYYMSSVILFPLGKFLWISLFLKEEAVMISKCIDWVTWLVLRCYSNWFRNQGPLCLTITHDFCILLETVYIGVKWNLKCFKALRYFKSQWFALIIRKFISIT